MDEHCHTLMKTAMRQQQLTAHHLLLGPVAGIDFVVKYSNYQ